MSESADKSGARARHTPEPVTVTNWPLRDDRIWAWLLAGGCVAMGAGAGAVTESVPMGLLVFLALAISAWRLWVPVTFVFSSKGIIQIWFGRRRRIAWRDIARFETYAGGVLVLADAERSFLSPLRGLFIKWNGQRAEILQILEHYLQRDSTSAGSSTAPYLSDSRSPRAASDSTLSRP